MIRTILVESDPQLQERPLHQGAIELARRTRATLRTVRTASVDLPGEGENADPIPPDPGVSADLMDSAASANVRVATTLELESRTEGLIDGSEKGDLFVTSNPLPEDPDGDPAADRVRALLRAGASSVLAGMPAQPAFGHLYIDCRNGPEGLWALRFGSCMAEAFGSRVTLGAIRGDKRKASRLTGAAATYLSAAPDIQVEQAPRMGVRESPGELVEAAGDAGADLIVHGAMPYGIVERMVSGFTAEALAEASAIPILIAR